MLFRVPELGEDDRPVLSEIDDFLRSLGAAMWHAVEGLVTRLGLHPRTTSALYDLDREMAVLTAPVVPPYRR